MSARVCLQTQNNSIQFKDPTINDTFVKHLILYLWHCHIGLTLWSPLFEVVRLFGAPRVMQCKYNFTTCRCKNDCRNESSQPKFGKKFHVCMFMCRLLWVYSCMHVCKCSSIDLCAVIGRYWEDYLYKFFSRSCGLSRRVLEMWVWMGCSGDGAK